MKQQLLNILKSKDYTPQSTQQLFDQLGLHSAQQFKAFCKLLTQLEQQQIISRNYQDKFVIKEQKQHVQGILSINKRGFGFVKISEHEPDIFIPQTALYTAMAGDEVVVALSNKQSGDKQEGRIISIVTRHTTRVIGTYSAARNFGFVLPDDRQMTKDIFIPKGQSLGAMDGHKVLVEISDYGSDTTNPEGHIIQIIGHKNDPGVDILSIIYKYGIPIEFSEDVMSEVHQVEDVVSPEEMTGRRDLREQCIVTIDGADAKDLDDAISVEKLANGHYKLGVHIADVSHYVTAGSALDQSAYERGTSVYLVDRVVPMLPHRLSNGICSLNPQVDRLTLSCEMEFTAQGQLVHYEIFESVIKTKARLTYHDVNLLLAGDENLRQYYDALTPMLLQAQQLAEILNNTRRHRGAIDFDIAEAKVIVDEQGQPIEIVSRERGVSERLIEAFMLAANETIALHFAKANMPFIYRVHEEPKVEKLQKFFEFITNFGVLVNGTSEDIHPKTLQNIMTSLEESPEEMVVATMMLRSMQQARYSADNLGHFGLAAEYYTHFTSPIRRYPDLIVHRLIRQYLIHEQVTDEQLTHWESIMDDIASHTSKCERRAVDCEREVDALKKAEYMQRHIGEQFEGIISSVTNFGIFVELPNTIEGLIHVTQLTDDYYRFDERHMVMIGERHGRVLRLGERIEVKCEQVNLEERSIDFTLVGMPQATTRQTAKRPVIIKTKSINSTTRQAKKKKSSAPKTKKPFYKAVAKKGKRKKSRK